MPTRSDAPPLDDLALAQDCVMCGICIPHCPTFALSGNEADGPRGRISLVLGLRSGEIPADAGVIRHLDSCLTCRACEAVCPSKVRYGELIDATRATLAAGTFRPTDQSTTLVNRASQQPWKVVRDQILTRRHRLGRALRLANLVDTAGLGSLVRLLGGSALRTLWRSLPPPPQRTATGRLPFGSQSACEPNGRRVGLFVGCTGEAMNAGAVRAAHQVLLALGFEVVMPAAQTCCGAMHRHGGDPVEADRLIRRNRDVFAAPGIEAIVVVGTACAAELQEQDAGPPVREITAFLADLPDSAWPALPPMNATAAIQLPCSQTRVLHQPDSSQALLARIPGLKTAALAGNDRCCGAAGMHVLLYPEQAEQLRAPKLAAAAQLRPDYLVSANVGCATHLAAGLRDHDGAAIEVLQPVELLARALADATKTT